jgi:hypothetical protein
MTVTAVESGPRVVIRTAEVNAPAAELFALVANPHKHGEIDGSGTVKDTVKGPDTLSKGATFSVNMKQYGLPYRIKSKVTAFDDGTLIEWQHPAGHRWRWEFEALTPTTTKVTETWDATTALPPAKVMYGLVGQASKNAAGIEATLTGLQARYHS